jgi:hypothetical protein
LNFSDTIRDQLRKRQWSVKKFADEIGRSPEHARKLRNGTAFPSGDLALRIAAKLELNSADFQLEIDAARWEKTRGRKPPQADRPDLVPLEGIWNELTAEQREYVVCVANCLLLKRIRKPQAG